MFRDTCPTSTEIWAAANMTVISITSTIRAGAHRKPTWRIIAYEMAIRRTAKTAMQTTTGMTEPLRISANVLSKPRMATKTEVQKPALARRDRTESEVGESVGVGAGTGCIVSHMSLNAMRLGSGSLRTS